MRSFFKMLAASFVALVLFTIILFFFLLAVVGRMAASDQPQVYQQSVLVIDLAQHFAEYEKQQPLGLLRGGDSRVPALYDVIRLIKHAGDDERISGIYILANGNNNGFAASEELRQAIGKFKTTGKFVFAFGDMITQKAYSVASIADRFYVSPQGFVEWSGYNVTYAFFKGTLDKLEIKPQIFYAGKFKSATEPFRTDRMTPENQLQTAVWLNDLYNSFLMQTAEVRQVDTATLHRLANEGLIRSAADAVQHKLIDGVRYDDEVKDEIKAKLKIGKLDKINFLPVTDYYATNPIRQKGEKIAMIVAEGDIIDGKSDPGTIGSDTYRSLIRKARLDVSVKAIVLRVNSGGGSALASETIWRELSLARAEKPVIVSFGDVAASGGYYIACGADSIFAQRSTITGSIGVFGMLPDMQNFFKNKLGVTFDGVKTAPHADAGAIYRPLTDTEKQMLQQGVERTYAQFKQRVAEGRSRDTSYVDSIGQGRVWTGMRAQEIGLIDRFGGIEDAVQCAARKAKLEEYQVLLYPESPSLLQQLLGKPEPMNFTDKLKAEWGEENYRLYLEMKRIKEMATGPQTRLPFTFYFNQ